LRICLFNSRVRIQRTPWAKVIRLRDRKSREKQPRGKMTPPHSRVEATDVDHLVHFSPRLFGPACVEFDTVSVACYTSGDGFQGVSCASARIECRKASFALHQGPADAPGLRLGQREVTHSQLPLPSGRAMNSGAGQTTHPRTGPYRVSSRIGLQQYT